MPAYVYNVETRKVHAVFTGPQAEKFANLLADGEEFAVTCTPAFGSNDGLVECLDANEYDTGDADFSLYNCSL
jgi:hypothetical protein